MILIQKYRNSNEISGGSLAKLLGIKIYSPKSAPRDKNQLKINWGLTSIPWLTDENIINNPEFVKKSSNKLLCFSNFATYNLHNTNNPVSYVPFTTDKLLAEQWVTEGKVVCRTLLSASSGRGIVIADNLDSLVTAPLYTKYIKKKWELRVHILNNRPIHIQQKKRLSTEQLEARGITNRNKYIRNLENGYIFSSELDVSEATKNEAILQSNRAIVALGLDFGAVDILVTKDDEVFVLEVNTAPGLEGTTLTRYYEAFKRELLS